MQQELWAVYCTMIFWQGWIRTENNAHSNGLVTDPDKGLNNLFFLHWHSFPSSTIAKKRKLLRQNQTSINGENTVSLFWKQKSLNVQFASAFKRAIWAIHHSAYLSYVFISMTAVFSSYLLCMHCCEWDYLQVNGVNHALEYIVK